MKSKGSETHVGKVLCGTLYNYFAVAYHFMNQFCNRCCTLLQRPDSGQAVSWWLFKSIHKVQWSMGSTRERIMTLQAFKPTNLAACGTSYWHRSRWSSYISFNELYRRRMWFKWVIERLRRTRWRWWYIHWWSRYQNIILIHWVWRIPYCRINEC